MYLQDSDFRCAINLDAKEVGKALTWYGFHYGEEEQESFQFWYALRSNSGIDEETKKKIREAAPNRIKLYNAVMTH